MFLAEKNKKFEDEIKKLKKQLFQKNKQNLNNTVSHNYSKYNNGLDKKGTKKNEKSRASLLPNENIIDEEL
jgi:hypothetical protein